MPTDENLEPCPFCGSAFLIGQEPHDNHPVAGKFYIYHDFGPIDSEARKCRIDVRGHFDTEADAAAFWNRRAALSAQDGAVGVVANCCRCGRIIDTREEAEGGDAFGCELEDGRWTCSFECWDAALTPAQEAGAEPKTEFDDACVQKVYEILCTDPGPPPSEHWEGYTARLIVDALFPPLDRGDEWEPSDEAIQAASARAITALPTGANRSDQPRRPSRTPTSHQRVLRAAAMGDGQ